MQSRLVLRTTKDVEITPRGWELYQCAEKIFLLRDSLVESWQMETEQVINLGASTIPSVYILPEVLPGFLKANPGIQIHIHQGDSREIISQVLEGLKSMDPYEKRLRVVGKKDTEGRTGVVSVQTVRRELAQTAYELDVQYGIMTRVGLHCAPSAHQTLGTFPTGTIRFSFGWWNTREEAALALQALDELL